MAIQWNKVTWYSKLLAIILFVVTFYVGYNLGEQKKEISVNNTIPQKISTKSVTPISINTKNIKEENFTGKIPVISGTSIVTIKARTYIDQTVADFRKQANADVPATRKQFGADNPTANYEIDIDANYIKSTKIESIVMTVYSYTGGAHGNTLYKAITASVPAGKILSLSNIIKKEEQVAFTEFIKKELSNWIPQGSDVSPVFGDDVKNLKFDSFKNWSLDDKNLIIYFDQYAIGPGALGEIPFPLPLEKIKNFLF